MDILDFMQSLNDSAIPKEILALPQSDLLAALWHEGRGEWVEAHEIAQQKETPLYCWVHAYLHRKEGDQWNAAYWYKRAGKPVATNDLVAEWKAIVEDLLGQK
jgi:hypothetical protein